MSSSEERELQKRAFWVIYIIERLSHRSTNLNCSEHRIPCINPGTRLDVYEDSIGLPYGPDNPFPADPGPNRIYEIQGYYFLAHIKMRQTLNKGNKLPRNISSPLHRTWLIINRSRRAKSCKLFYGFGSGRRAGSLVQYFAKPNSLHHWFQYRNVP